MPELREILLREVPDDPDSPALADISQTSARGFRQQGRTPKSPVGTVIVLLLARGAGRRQSPVIGIRKTPAVLKTRKLVASFRIFAGVVVCINRYILLL
jgi:hypothetical protein